MHHSMGGTAVHMGEREMPRVLFEREKTRQVVMTSAEVASFPDSGRSLRTLTRRFAKTSPLDCCQSSGGVPHARAFRTMR